MTICVTSVTVSHDYEKGYLVLYVPLRCISNVGSIMYIPRNSMRYPSPLEPHTTRESDSTGQRATATLGYYLNATGGVCDAPVCIF